MAKKASGVSTKAARKAYNAVKEHLEILDKLIPALQADVESLNQNYWYGGVKANSWYESMDSVFAQLINFDNGVSQLQDALLAQFKKSDAISGITF